MTLDFQVMNMERADVVLGREWLHGLGPSLKRSYEHNTITFSEQGTHVLLISGGGIYRRVHLYVQPSFLISPRIL